MSWHPTTTRWHRAIITIFAVLFLTGVVLVAAGTLAQPAQASVSVDDFTAQGTNQTVDGVSDVRLTADLAYEYDVEDADRVLIRLYGGPSGQQLEELTFHHMGKPASSDSGTVTLEASLLDHSSYSAGDFEPALAESTAENITVRAEIVVERETGETVEQEVVDTATVELHDSTELTAGVGGEVVTVVDE